MKQGDPGNASSDDWCGRLDFCVLTGLIGGVLLALLGLQALWLSVLGILLLTLLSWPWLLRGLKEKTLSTLQPRTSAPVGSPPMKGNIAGVLLAILLLVFLFVLGVGAVGAVLSALICLLGGEQNPRIPFGRLWPLYPPLGALLGLALWWLSGPGSGKHRAG